MRALVLIAAILITSCSGPQTLQERVEQGAADVIFEAVSEKCGVTRDRDTEEFIRRDTGSALARSAWNGGQGGSMYFNPQFTGGYEGQDRAQLLIDHQRPDPNEIFCENGATQIAVVVTYRPWDGDQRDQMDFYYMWR